MVIIDQETLQISASKGDNLSLKLILYNNENPDMPLDIRETDRAVFTIRVTPGSEEAKIEKNYAPQRDGPNEDWFVLVDLSCEEMDALYPDDYCWDLRLVTPPVNNDDGTVISRKEVGTPMEPALFMVLEVVGRV